MKDEDDDDKLLISDDTEFEAELLQQLERVRRHSTKEEGESSSATEETRYALPKPEAKGDYRDDDAYGVTGFGQGGLYLRNKRKKMQVQYETFVQQNGGAERPQIFKGLAVYINGYTKEATVQDLSRHLTLHGGLYVPYLDRKSLVTHIVASELTPKKRDEFRQYKIATPQWILDSVEAGRLLDWKKYALLAAHEPMPASRFEYDNADARLGSQRAQPSIFKMLGQKRQNEDDSSDLARKKVSPPHRDDTIAVLSSDEDEPTKETGIAASTTTVGSEYVETMESLSERGRRLAEAAIAAEAPGASTSSAANFFQPRPPSRTTSPVKKARNQVAAPTTAVRYDVTYENHPYLPRRAGNARTSALLDDPTWMSRHTSASEDFLSTYFAQSRLHHISTWKEELKALVAELQPVSSIPQRSKKLTGLPSDGRTIMHVDFDCFFVSAGLTKRPELRGRPIAVCHASAGLDSDSSTSEIASCSYEARDKGVKNGMSLGRARELCPDIKTIPFEFELYKNIASKFYSILLKHAILLQAVSIDEVLMEIKASPASSSQDALLDFAHSIRAEIFEATGCSASIGISHNILLARLASRKAKPASAYHLVPADVESHLAPLAVDALPGIGWSTRDKLEAELKITTVGGLIKMRPSELARVIGKQNGEKFMQFAKGIDARELDVGRARQSVSTEVNYGIRFENHDQVKRFMLELGAETARRLREIDLKARKLTLKVMQRHPDAPVEAPKFLGHGWCVSQSASSSIADQRAKATDDGQIVGQVAFDLLERMDIPFKELRGIAIQLHKLEKDGRSVDAVLEKGQGKLSFGAARQTIPGSSKPEDDAQITPPPGDIPKEPIAGPSRPRAISSAEPISPIVSPPLDPGRQTRSKSLSKAQDASIIILDDDSDEDVQIFTQPPRSLQAKSVPAMSAAVVAAISTRSKGKSRQTPEPTTPKVPRMFKTRRGVGPPPPPSTSQVEDKEIQHYGFDVAVFRTLPREVQSEQLAEARRSTLPAKGARAATPFGVVGLVTKPGISSNMKGKARARSESVKPNNAIPVIELPPTPPVAIEKDGQPKWLSPTTVTEEQLREMDLDPEWLGALPENVQREQLRNRALFLKKKKRLTVASDRKTAGGSNTTSDLTKKKGALNKAVQVNIRSKPSFQKRTETDDVLQLMEVWCSAPDLPDSKDVDRVARFLEKCVERERGHDLKKATDVLKWIEMLLQDEVGKKEEASTDRAKIWWERYRELVMRVEVAVKKEYGASVVL